MKHEWTGFRGCSERCLYCGVLRTDAKSLDCNNEDVKKRWEDFKVLTPQELLRLSPQEQERYIRVAAEEAAPLYAADLALPPQERELTALSALSGAESVAYWQEKGCLGVFADNELDSPELARSLREEAGRRDWSEALILYVVYQHPKDFPEEIVCRRWFIDGRGPERPDAELYLSERELDNMVIRLQARGLTQIASQDAQDPCIVGVWV